MTGREIRAGEALEALSVVPPAMRHPPVLLRPAAAAQPAATDPAPIAATLASHLYSNTSHHPTSSSSSSPCPPTHHSSFQSTGATFSAAVAAANHSSSSSANNHCDGNVVATTTTTATVAGSGGPSSAFSGSAPSLIGPLLPSARRYVAVRLLTGETLQFDVEVRDVSLLLLAASGPFVVRCCLKLFMRGSSRAIDPRPSRVVAT